MNLDNYQWAEYRPPCPVLIKHWDIAFGSFVPEINNKPSKINNKFNNCEDEQIYFTGDLILEPRSKYEYIEGVNVKTQDYERIKLDIRDVLIKGIEEIDKKELHAQMVACGYLTRYNGETLSYTRFVQIVREVKTLYSINGAYETKSMEILKLHKINLTRDEIIKQTGCTRSLYYKTLTYHGILNSKTRRNEHGKSKADAIINLFKNEIDIKEIHKLANTERRYVTKVLIKANLIK